MSRNRAGFSLVEILIAVSLIAIIAAFTVPTLGSSNSSSDSSARASLSTALSAELAILQEQGTFSPTTDPHLTSLFGNPANKISLIPGDIGSTSSSEISLALNTTGTVAAAAAQGDSRCFLVRLTATKVTWATKFPKSGCRATAALILNPPTNNPDAGFTPSNPIKL